MLGFVKVQSTEYGITNIGGQVKQFLLKMEAPKNAPAMYATVFREKLAKASDLPAEFFHRDEAGIVGSCRTPVFRIVGGKTWTGILGTGEHSRDLLHAAIAPALDVCTKHYNQAIKVGIDSIDLHIKELETYKLYWVREMVVKNGTQGLTVRDLETFLAKKIKKSIGRQAVDSMLEGYLPSEMDIRVVSVDRQLGMRLQTSQGWTKQYVGLFNLTVAMPLNLKGMWFAGNLTSRGYGRIIPVNNYSAPASRIETGKDE